MEQMKCQQCVRSAQFLLDSNLFGLADYDLLTLIVSYKGKELHISFHIDHIVSGSRTL